MEGIVGGNVKQARERAGVSQEELARQLGISVFTVSRIERGAVGVSVRRLRELAQALGVTAGSLLGDGGKA